MADTDTANNVAQTVRAQRSKITLTALGNATLVKTMSPEELAANKGKYYVGRIYGGATDEIERASPDGQDKFPGLKGSFVAIPSDRERYEEMESGVLFIPDAFHNLISDKLREIKKTSDIANVEFAFDCYSIPAKNPAGYSWELVPAVPFTGVHPLGNLMERARLFDEQKAKQLTDQRAGADKGKRK